MTSRPIAAAELRLPRHVLVAHLRELQPQRQHVLRIEAGVHGAHAHECLRQQARARQKDERHREFHDDQPGPHPARRRSRRPRSRMCIASSVRTAGS
jgi:hypothetical protein